jgi:RNA polymerase sigma factor (sigma-70 family)
MATNTAIDLEVLLAHERWAGRLARALLRDDDLAEDVVQEARVSFWRKGPDDPTRARSWLGTVIRNLVRNQARSRQRQQDRLTATGSSAETAPSAEQLAEQLEGHRLLAALVGQLREPFREAILLRYYEGRSGAEIARLLGVPAGTVRWRIKSGLDQLRAGLDERHGGRRQAWLVLLAGLAKGQGAVMAPAAGGAMTTWPLVAVAGLVGAAGLIALLVMLGARGSVRTAASKAAGSDRPAPAGTVEASGGPRPPGPPALRAAGATEVAERGERVLPAWAEMPGFPPRVIAGRVTSGGVAVPGASLRLSAGMLTHARSLDRHATAGANGQFAFPPQAATNWFLTASAPGVAPQILYVDLRATQPRVKPRMDPPEALVIDLGPCQVYATGKVHDAGGGMIAGARVKVTRFWNNGGTAVQTDLAGRYRICVPAGNGDLTLVAEADGYGAVETLGKLDQSREIDFVLEPGASVHGRALHESDGRPLPGVKVTLEPQSPADPNNPPVLGTQPLRLETETDEQGHFQIDGLAPGAFRVQVVGNDLTATDLDERVVELAAGQRLRDVELRLSDSAVVEGIALRDGHPAPNVVLGFQVRGIPWVPPPQHSRWPMTKTGPDGRFRRQFKRGTVVERIVGEWPRNKAPGGFVVDRSKITGMVVELP